MAEPACCRTEPAIGLTRALAIKYKANRRVPPYPVFFDGVVSAIKRRGWWLDSPPRLLGSSDQETGELASFLIDVLADLERSGHIHPYSLLTKWLHFCFPNSFAMANSQAAKSIEEVCVRHDSPETGSSWRTRRLRQTVRDTLESLTSIFDSGRCATLRGSLTR